MPCEPYQNALVEAASSGREPQGELRAHLATCAECRATFAQEQSLFSFIDSGLHAAANVEIPASLLPRVRTSIAEEPASNRAWSSLWTLATASVALAFAIFLFARSHHAGLDNQAKQSPQPPVIEISATDTRHPNSEPAPQIVWSNVKSSQTPRHSTLLLPVTSSQPEVLVPPDEREALARFVAVLQERREVAVAFVTPTAPANDQSASLEPLQIKGLEIKLLEERQIETPDGPERKQ
jgi:hypothetical protein